jgi:CRISPR/Cas system-associated exonuclease Cas4 (RecB family)
LAAVDPGLYNTDPAKMRFTFHFLNEGVKISTTRTVSQLNKAKKEIEQVAAEISRSDFVPSPGRWCDFCDYRLLCQAWK